MSAEANEQAAIEAGAAMASILVNPHFTAATKRVEKDYLAEFMDANTDEARRQIWAKVRALQDLVVELGATEQGGKVAKATREKREAGKPRPRS